MRALRSSAKRIHTYSEAEEERLARQLETLATDLWHGAFANYPLRIALLCEFHERLFAGVRSHAGRIRTPDFGSERLTFGPNRSEHRDEVPRLLEELFEFASRELRGLRENSDVKGYELAAITLAIRLHADVVKIHPFEDGNGRSSRMLLNWTLLHLGLIPVAFEVPKEEYRACLNRYFVSRDIGLLLDLYLHLIRDSFE